MNILVNHFKITNFSKEVGGFVKKYDVRHVFFFCAMPILLFFALFVPVGESPDEPTHILRADSVRHFAISGFRFDVQDALGHRVKDVGVRADPGLLEAVVGFPAGADKQETLGRLAQKRAIPWRGHREIVSVPNTGVYPVTYYIPLAIGLEIARLADFGAYDSIIAARLAGGLSYLAIGTLALSLAKRGRTTIFMLLCLPMTLFLAASVSQDGLLIASLCLAAALWTSDPGELPDRRRWLIGCAIFGLAAMAKPYIAPLAVVGWIRMPAPTPSIRWQRTSGAALMLAPAILWSLAMAAFVSTPFLRAPTPPGPLWSGASDMLFAGTSPIDQLHVVLAHPYALLKMSFETMQDPDLVLRHEAVGVLGPLQWPLSDDLYEIWSWVILASMLAELFSVKRGRLRPHLGHFAGFCASLGACASSVFLICFLQYLTWTTVGAVHIDGIQGRYFLLIVALMIPILSVPVFRFPGADSVRFLFSLPAVLMTMVGMAPLASVILHAYYIR